MNLRSGAFASPPTPVTEVWLLCFDAHATQESLNEYNKVTLDHFDVRGLKKGEHSYVEVPSRVLNPLPPPPPPPGDPLHPFRNSFACTAATSSWPIAVGRGSSLVRNIMPEDEHKVMRIKPALIKDALIVRSKPLPIGK